MKHKKEIEKKSNACGIVGLCTGWFCPLAGLILGIIALARREKTKVLGILSIIESVAFWLFWIAILGI